VNDGVIRDGRKQGQHHCTNDAQPQAAFDKPVRAHGIPRPHQIAEVVHRRHQSGAGQGQLPCRNHQRHLWCKGKAPYSHRHHQNHKTAERDTQRHDHSSC